MQWIYPDGSPERIRGVKNRAFWLPASFPFLHPTWLVPMKIYTENGLYSTDFQIAGDMEMYYRLSTSGVKFRYLDKVTVDFHLGGISNNLSGIYETTQIHRYYSGNIRAEIIRIFSYMLRAKNHIRNVFRRVVG